MVRAADQADCGAPGSSQRSIDIAAFADDGSHLVEFAAGVYGAHGGVTNFHVDRVSIDLCGGAGGADGTAFDAIADGSFEGGTPNAACFEWNSLSSTPLCSSATCGGVGPADGSWWAWFGGVAGFMEFGLAQSVVISAGATTLTFDYWASACDL